MNSNYKNALKKGIAFRSLLRMPLMVLLMLGCSERKDVQEHHVDDGMAQILGKIDKMQIMVKSRRTQKIRDVAFDLCTAIQAVTNSGKRVECIDHFTNMLARIAVDTNFKNTAKRSVLESQEDELANYWAFAHWGFSLASQEWPNDTEVWGMPIKALEYYKNAISTIDKSTVDDKAVKRTVSWHKKNMEISFNGWMRCLDLLYSSRKHLLSDLQRREIRQKVKRALDGLPPEMAKEDCEDN